MSDFYSLPKLDIPTMSSDERVGLATLLCLQAAELLDGITTFEWQIGECDDYEIDGQPDDYQENSDYAQDGYFENMECDGNGYFG